mgnify:FL=1
MEVQNLQSITTRFDEHQDRFRLDALLKGSSTVSFWLTQRLLIRMIKHCLGTLKKQTGEIFNSQQDHQTNRAPPKFTKEVKRDLRHEEAVFIEDVTPNFLIQEVDISSGSAGVVLIFKEPNCSYSLALSHNQLRQWLQIVYDLWVRAEWQVSIWPSWITQVDSMASGASISIH